MPLQEDNGPTVAGETEEVATEAEGAATLEQALAEEKAKAERYLANWQRAEADFANYKRRAEQEKNELATSAISSLILNLLPILDDLERAFTSLPPNIAKFTWVEGISLIQRKLEAILEAHGLAEIQTVGQPFDPALHEAVTYEEGGEEGIVKGEFQKGYKFRGRVIRPSLVVVGRDKEEAKTKVEGQPEGGE